MISDILGCLAGKAQMPSEIWGTEGLPFNGQRWEDADWREVFSLARVKGVQVKNDGEAVYMVKGRHNGRFLNVQGGADLARQFLEGVR
jgi:hypothetical protein